MEKLFRRLTHHQLTDVTNFGLKEHNKGLSLEDVPHRTKAGRALQEQVSLI